MLSGLAMKTRDPPRPLETFAPPPLLPSSLRPLLELMLLLLPKEEEHLEGLDAFLVALCVCALSLVFFPQIIQRAAQSFVAAVTRYGSLVDLPGPSRVAEGDWVCVGLCAYLITKRPYAVPRPLALNRPISNGTWRCAALRCVALIWSALDSAGCAAIRFKCESAVANMNRKMLLIYCDTNIH